uniref:Reverse transcriptase domain-containing protein n=1 Tax=Oryzias latipes TaxID=8090 RepID=A0A3P9I2H4_ORYLA
MVLSLVIIVSRSMLLLSPHEPLSCLQDHLNPRVDAPIYSHPSGGYPPENLPPSSALSELLTRLQDRRRVVGLTVPCHNRTAHFPLARVMTERTGQTPDPADPEGLRLAVTQQGIMLGRQADALTQMASVQQDLFRRLDGLTQTLLELTGHSANSATGPPALSSGNIAASSSGSANPPENFRLQPEPFLGDVEACGGFLLQCQLIFQQAPRYFHSDHSKITLIINSLRNKALQWAQAFVSANPITHLRYEHFLNEFRLIFDQPRKREEATRKLLNLKQRNRTVSEHVIDFRILAVEAGWPDLALKGIFYQSLNETIKDHLCTQPEANSFEDLVTAALRSDIRLRERHHDRQQAPKKNLNNPALSTITALPPHRMDFLTSSKPSEEPMKVHVFIVVKHSFLYIPVRLCWKTQTHASRALIDSGAEQSLIDHGLVSKLGLPIELLEAPVEASGLGGQHLSRITHRTKPVKLLTSGNHREVIQFFVTQSTHTPIVLGYSWLKLHNPQFNWSLGHIINWSPYCSANCLSSALPSTLHHAVDSPSKINLDKIPSCYHDLQDVFCKSKASALPPHRPYDCEIKLLPGSTLPKGHLYNLSGPEKISMESYIQEALALGHIRPSSSPVGAGFFFVEKKDKSLRPCVDYRELNLITIKDKYSLPLISSVFDSVQGAHVFSKLDLRNAYHLVRVKEGDEWKTAFNTPLGHYEYLVMPFGLTNAPAVFQRLVNDVLRDFLNRFVFVYLDDILIYSDNLTQHEQHVRQVLTRLLENQLFVKAEKCEFHVDSVQFLGYIIEAGRIKPDPSKIEAVSSWEPPINRKKLQQFLGFANFYRRFIRNYSSIAAPLTRLTSTHQRFQWTQEAQQAFDRLKKLFVTAPILIQPDPSRQFIVEVDASDSGVGAVLSQKELTSGKLKPCAFFSKKLSTAEQNYDVGNRELLAIKLALEEWRHWLEGAEHPFIVWTDHKNLAYLRTAKRLNSRQARWCLFFDRFRFTITYRPGTRNVKPDALSRKYSTTENTITNTIVPSTCIVGALTWDIENRVLQAQGEEPGHWTPQSTPTQAEDTPQRTYLLPARSLNYWPPLKPQPNLQPRHRPQPNHPPRPRFARSRHRTPRLVFRIADGSSVSPSPATTGLLISRIIKSITYFHSSPVLLPGSSVWVC